MPDIPLILPLLFGLITIGTLVWFYFVCRSVHALLVLVGWAVLQSALALSGLYMKVDVLPPLILALGVLPTIIAMVLVFQTRAGRAFVDSFNLKTLTYLSTIRVPVEIFLALFYHAGAISVLMTFEGTNFDILAGISAPIVAFVAFRQEPKKRKLLLWWNIMSLGLLLNVVITAALAAPFPFQQLAFDQPNVGILYFPYCLLPTVVVPIVIFGHIAAFRHLRK